jgi:hypothetical protein
LLGFEYKEGDCKLHNILNYVLKAL